MIFVNYTPEVLRQGRYEDLCIRSSEIKDMAVRLQLTREYDLLELTDGFKIGEGCDKNDGPIKTCHEVMPPRTRTFILSEKVLNFKMNCLIALAQRTLNCIIWNSSF